VVNEEEWKKPRSPWMCAVCYKVSWYSKLKEEKDDNGSIVLVCPNPKCGSEDVFPNCKKDWDEAEKEQKRFLQARDESDLDDWSE